MLGGGGEGGEGGGEKEASLCLPVRFDLAVTVPLPILKHRADREKGGLGDGGERVGGRGW